jgi:hypothetical protein
MRILSLGAGVQSSTLALMIAHGEVPMVDAAIFADTGWEPKKVYTWLDWLEKQLPFPVHRVAAGNLRDDIIAGTNSTGQTFRSVPWHMLKPNGETAMGMRQCTSEYKIKPVHRKVRELLGYAPRKRIPAGATDMLMGISLDEIFRMKPSWHKWLVHQWPLIDAGMARHDCLTWMERRGYPLPPKSSCIGCPFHSNDEWRSIKSDPEAWEDAVMLDKLIRNVGKNMKSQQFMHRDRVPLDEVDLSTAADHGQVDMFNNECEGMCGL